MFFVLVFVVWGLLGFVVFLVCCVVVGLVCGWWSLRFVLGFVCRVKVGVFLNDEGCGVVKGDE